MSVAIVDESGNILAYARMENLWLFSQRHALRKAYTAAVIGADTGAYAEQLKNEGIYQSISDLGDPNLTPDQGGVVVRSKDGVIMGGIGVSGYPGGQWDEDLCRVGIQAMNI